MKRSQRLAKESPHQEHTAPWDLTLCKALWETSDCQLAYLDWEFNIIQVNEQYVRGSGYCREDLIGRNHFELFPNDENFKIFTEVRDSGLPAVFKERPFVFEDPPLRRVTFWNWRLTPLKNEAGRTQTLLLSLQDVTDQVREREALATSNKRLNVAMAHAGSVFFCQDLDLRYTWIQNPLWGWDEAKVLGKTDSDLFEKKDAARLTAIKKRVIQSGEGACEDISVTVNGERSTFELIVEPEFNRESKITGILCSSVDISDRKREERRSEKERIRLKRLLQVSSDVLTAETVDEILSRVVTGARDLIGAMVGIARFEFLEGSIMAGRSFRVTDRAPQASRHRALQIAMDEYQRKLFDEVAALDKAQSQDRSASQRTIEVDVRKGLMGVKLSLKNNLGAGVIVVGDTEGPFTREDAVILKQLATLSSQALKLIASRTEAQSRAVEKEEGNRILEALMAYIPEGIAIAEGPEMTIKMISRFGQRMIGRQPGEVEHIPVRDQGDRWNLISLDGNPIPLCKLPMYRAACHGEVVTDEQLVLERPDGSVVPVSCNSGPIFDGQRQIVGAVMAFRDITERKRVEDQLLEANRRKDEFLALLAHELRNPLAPLVNAAQILKSARNKPNLNEKALDVIHQQVWQMVHLIDDLLDVSRITRGKIALSKKTVELAMIVESSVTANRGRVAEKGHRLEIALPEEPIYIEADFTRMTQVISNLLSNAVKYTPNGGLIHVSVERVGEEVEIRVVDSGVGIPEAALPKLFQMFSQVETVADSSREGLGVGLALAKKLTEMHGGTIHGKSFGIHRGSEFVVRLPAMETRQLGLPDPSADAQTRPDSRESGLPPLNILVVDDNVGAAESLGYVLDLMGHDVTVLTSGKAALKEVENAKPDVAILDIGMPGMNGFEVAQKLRHKFSSEELLLIAFTGYGQNEDRQRSKMAGFDHHLVKPVKPDTLKELLYQFRKSA